jgi:hypothetical protein
MATAPGGAFDLGGRDRDRLGFKLLHGAQMIGATYDRTAMSEDLERVSPSEHARVRARDKKVRGPKVVAVNPGLKKLAQHLADKRKKKAKG